MGPETTSELPTRNVVPRSPANADSGDEAYLVQLGRRVRSLREARGLARRELAKVSNVSERYLAQIEAGGGNISVVLLRRVALALNVPIAEFFTSAPEAGANAALARLLQRVPPHRVQAWVVRMLRELDPQDAQRTHRVALIGLRGAGKSTLGSMLADALQVPFIELDREIEREVGMSLSEVFALYGQPGYRRIERRALERVLQAQSTFVLSTGGGIVSETDTYDLLLTNCLTVWLRADPEAHMARVAAQGDFRPMAGNSEAMKDLRRILSAREPLYEKADAVVDTTEGTTEDSLARLRAAIASWR